MKNIFLILFIAIAGCNSNNTTKTPLQTKDKKHNPQKIDVQLSINNNGLQKTIGDKITINYNIKKKTEPDSIKLAIDYRNKETFYKGEPVVWDTQNDNPGIREANLVLYWGDSINSSASIKIELLSDIIPKQYTYKTINKWPHSTKAYTQGLEFSEGYLYEGTGEYGKSMLFKIDLDKNEIIHSINLSSDMFGEGITIFDDKIYQITWRSNIGYVYEKNTLKELYEFSYPTEGWGLTHNNSELIMSDGSENIYFLDTEYIQETKRIQVYDNKGAIKYLNELEFIDGLIFANIYGSDNLVAFDPKTGKVLKHINLSGILNKQEVKTPIDVLNGIAWDKENNRLIVTGKWWPYFFEIKLQEK